MRPERFAALLAGALLACTPARHHVRDDVQRVSAQAGTCESFAGFDDEVRTVRKALHSGGTTSELLQLDAQLKLARRKCAQHVLTTLMEQRTSEEVQTELDAMARALDEATLRAMVHAAWGDDPSLRTRVEMAVATAQAERRAELQARGDDAALAGLKTEVPEVAPPALDADTDTALARQCETRVPEEGLDCLGELAERGLPSDTLTPSVEALAQRLLKESAASPAAARSRRLDTFLGKLALVPGAKPPEVLLRELTTLRSTLWPEVLAAKKAGRPEHAAWLALPFLRLPGAIEDVQRLVIEASLSQATWASKATTRALAAALHRQVAARLSGGTAAPPALEPGHWDTSRSACKKPLPALRQPPGGVSLRVIARCTTEGPPPRPPTPAAMKTFELEDSLKWERVTGEVLATCGGEVQRFQVSVRDVVVEDHRADALDDEGGATGPGQALRVRLESVLREATERCRAAAEQELPSACGSLGNADVLDVEQRFIGLALRLGAWPPCFASWFEAHWGLPLPPLAVTPER